MRTDADRQRYWDEQLEIMRERARTDLKLTTKLKTGRKKKNETKPA